MRFEDIPQYTKAKYEIDEPWKYLEEWLVKRGLGTEHLDMDPPYQRGHVWSLEQRSRYVEFCLRGGTSGRDIYWNCSSWMKGFNTPLEIVDGKQRITTVRMFMRDEVTAFGCKLSEFDEDPPMDISFRFHIADLPTRREVIQWYLDLNYGGTPHTEEELERVRRMMEE